MKLSFSCSSLVLGCTKYERDTFEKVILGFEIRIANMCTRYVHVYVYVYI